METARYALKVLEDKRCVAIELPPIFIDLPFLRCTLTSFLLHRDKISKHWALLGAV